MTPATGPNELVQLLQNIEQRSRAQAVGLPQQEEIQPHWDGIVFYLGKTRLVAPLNEVIEILHLPADLTQVPGTQPWVRGVANIRGNLLPIVDLQLFLGDDSVLAGGHSRVLIIKHKKIFTGLLVKEVLGMRHFPQKCRIKYPSPDGLMGKFISTAFEKDEETWPVFSMFALAKNNRFQIASL